MSVFVVSQIGHPETLRKRWFFWSNFTELHQVKVKNWWQKFEFECVLWSTFPHLNYHNIQLHLYLRLDFKATQINTKYSFKKYQHKTVTFSFMMPFKLLLEYLKPSSFHLTIKHFITSYFFDFLPPEVPTVTFRQMYVCTWKLNGRTTTDECLG